ncbi:GNAT family N-acetyltransferase [Paenibacillus physcomitrellae]|uniref:N-acetyltransferase domain-containing protein n=1 Tax=Paenibacillus physcomitrellae TaxID=1619311 RepID=A0ABQ1FQ68_9BACL|nr:GNAT family N-acetyltransferase [Paenibacillus physcomitrellae]GGA23837.1 hypothetical protein GCM10010917_05750 [Paenibacillus physcomitrellae]
MLELRKLKSCTLEEAVQAWNEGFEGYAFDATTTPDAFLKRMAAEELSSELSFVAFQDGKPAGIILNGIRETKEQKIGWNGGTGVAALYRGSGVGRSLIEASLTFFREQGVQLATLEALSANEKAIHLYLKAGYVQTDELEHLSLKGPAEPAVMPSKQATDTALKPFELVAVPPVQMAHIPFYKALNPWQTQWQSARDAAVVKDGTGDTIGYAYWKKIYQPGGEHAATILYQCEALPGHPESVAILKQLIWHAFDGFRDAINRSVPNLPKSASALTGLVLKSMGFSPVVQQVYMTKSL